VTNQQNDSSKKGKTQVDKQVIGSIATDLPIVYTRRAMTIVAGRKITVKQFLVALQVA
jgi:hypothetical protein